MGTNHYRDGHRFELAIIDDLRSEGYQTIRAAGSKGKIDILAYKPGQTLAIQAKRNGKIPPAERAAVYELAAILGAVPIVAWKQRGTRRPLYDRLTGTGPKDRLPFTTDDLADPGANE